MKGVIPPRIQKITKCQLLVYEYHQCAWHSTWIGVQLTLYCLPNALEFHSLKGFVRICDGWQASQGIPDQICHFSHVKELQ